MSTIAPAATNMPAGSWFERGRIPAIDGLRALAILLVLLEHSSLSHGFPLVHDTRLGHIGRVGVSMFFAISGFLITTLLAREWTRHGTISLRDFYRRRALRILPAYIAFLLVVAVLTRVHWIELSRTDWIAVLTYTINFVTHPAWEVGHVWSLSVEEQFYLVWPCVLLVLSPKRAAYVAVAYLVGTPFVRLGIWAAAPGEYGLITELTPLRMDALASGCLLALLARNPAFVVRWMPAPRTAMLVVAGSVGVITGAYALGSYITAFDLTLRYSIVAGAMTAIIWATATAPQNMIGRILESRPFVTLGTLSYSLYLWQQLFLRPNSTHWMAAWPVNLLLAMGAGVVSYLVVESPFLRIKNRTAAPAVDEWPRPTAVPGVS